MKKLRPYLSVLLALVMAFSVFATLAIAPATTASAATKAVDLSATRYRYPIGRFENPKYATGVAVDDNAPTSAYLFTGNKDNGNTDMDLFFARIDDYDMFNMKLGKNKAFIISCGANTNPAVAASYQGYCFNLDETVGTRKNILPDSIQGIATNSTDHGVMFHLEIKGLPGAEADGYRAQNSDENGNYTGTYSIHEVRDLNFTFQEIDYKANGKVNMKKGSALHTALNTKPGAHITLIWTKDISWTNPDPEKYTEQKRETNGMPVRDADNKYVYQAIPSYNHKAGEVQILETYQYNADGSTLTGGGGIYFPRDFCGYVIIPFAEMHMTWDGTDGDGMLNMKNVELCNFYWGSYPAHEGEYIIDEFCFWGPTFAKVDGAYDYGNITFANHRDSLINRKLITIKEEEKSEEPSKEAPKVIETAVTLTNEATGIKLEAPTSAKIDKSVKLSADVLNVEENEFLKGVFDTNFGTDATQYAAYTLYLGADGDQEPEDFCQIDFPIPDGFDADKCAVYTLDDSSNVIAVESTLSEDKKTISIKTDSLGTFVLYQGGEIGGNGDESGDASEGDDASEAPSKDESKADTEKAEGSLTWLWIVIGAVVVIGAGLAVFFIVNGKKKAEPEAEETEEKTEE